MSEGTTRRGIMRAGGIAAAGVAAGAAGVPGYPPPSPIDAGGVQDGRVAFPPWRGEADPPGEPPPAPLPPEERVGFAIIGLGRISLEQALPAFAECRMAQAGGAGQRLAGEGAAGGAAIRHPRRGGAWLRPVRAAGRRPGGAGGLYRAAECHAPRLHRTRRGDRQACADREADGDQQRGLRGDGRRLRAGRCAADGRLSLPVRAGEPRRDPRRAGSGALGKLRFFQAANLQANGPGPQWRYSRQLAGGGALPDIGLYCLNAARFLSNEEPVEVIAQAYSPPGDERFREVEESMSFTLRFPSGLLAQAQSSYGAYQEKSLRLHGERGSLLMRRPSPTRASACTCSAATASAAWSRSPQIHPRNQFALEIDHMARCVREARRPHTPGEEGLRDQQIMEAIARAAASGSPNPSRRCRRRRNYAARRRIRPETQRLCYRTMNRSAAHALKRDRTLTETMMIPMMRLVAAGAAAAWPRRMPAGRPGGTRRPQPRPCRAIVRDTVDPARGPVERLGRSVDRAVN